MSAYKKTKTKRAGRAPLSMNEPTVQLGFKTAQSTENKILDAVEELKNLGHSTNKSEIVRILTEYLLDDAVNIYLETIRGKAIA